MLRKIRSQFPGQPLPSKQTWSISWKQQGRCYTKTRQKTECANGREIGRYSR